MKNWQFWFLIALIGVVLYVVVKTGLGLKSAQSSVANIITPIQDSLNTFLGKRV